MSLNSNRNPLPSGTGRFNNLLNDINAIDEIIHRLQKMESKMRSGQFIDAWRDCCGVMATLSRHKQQVIANSEKEKSNG